MKRQACANCSIQTEQPDDISCTVLTQLLLIYFNRPRATGALSSIKSELMTKTKSYEMQYNVQQLHTASYIFADC